MWRTIALAVLVVGPARAEEPPPPAVEGEDDALKPLYPPEETPLAPGLSVRGAEDEEPVALPPDAIPRELRKKNGALQRSARRELMQEARAVRKDIEAEVKTEAWSPPPAEGVIKTAEGPRGETQYEQDPLAGAGLAPIPPVGLFATREAEAEVGDASDPLGNLGVSRDVSIDGHGRPWRRSPEGIAEAIENLLPEMETCAARHLAQLDSAEALRQVSVRLSFVVDREGFPGVVDVVAGDTGPFSECVAQWLEELRFGEGATTQAVNVPVYVRVTR